MKKQCFSGLAALAFVLCCIQSAQASPINLNGTFTKDNDVQFFKLTLNSTQNVFVSTSSFGTTASGNFVPLLEMWMADGTTLGSGSPSLSSEPNPTADNASFNVENLTAGTYYLAISARGNLVNNDEFTGTPTGNFDSIYDPMQFVHKGAVDNDEYFLYSDYSCTPLVTAHFMFDFGGGCASRGGDWSLDFTNFNSVALYPAASVPEPAVLSLIISGILGGGAIARRRKALANI